MHNFPLNREQVFHKDCSMGLLECSSIAIIERLSMLCLYISLGQLKNPDTSLLTFLHSHYLIAKQKQAYRV